MTDLKERAVAQERALVAEVTEIEGGAAGGGTSRNGGSSGDSKRGELNVVSKKQLERLDMVKTALRDLKVSYILLNISFIPRVNLSFDFEQINHQMYVRC